MHSDQWKFHAGVSLQMSTLTDSDRCPLVRRPWPMHPRSTAWRPAGNPRTKKLQERVRSRASSLAPNKDFAKLLKPSRDSRSLYLVVKTLCLERQNETISEASSQSMIILVLQPWPKLSTYLLRHLHIAVNISLSYPTKKSTLRHRAKCATNPPPLPSLPLR